MDQRGGLGDYYTLNLPFPGIPQAEPALCLGAWLSFRYTAQKGMEISSHTLFLFP